MKKFTFLACLLLITGMMFSSCERPGDVDEQTSEFSQARLESGTWTIDKVDYNNFDTQGNLVSTDVIQFGEGTDGGICTFHYNDNKWTMNDNGDIFSTTYSLDGPVIATDGGGTWGIRSMSDTDLEVVLRGDESFNPCAYSITGAVYYLSRANR